MKTSLFNVWLLRDIGFLYWVADATRCKRLLESVEATFMGGAPWTVMIYSISRNRWKLRRMQNASFVELKNGHLLHLRAASIADSTPASVPLPLRVEPKPKSGIRQQDLLKKVVEIKPKRPRLSSPSVDSQSTALSTDVTVYNRASENNHLKEKGQSSSGSYIIVEEQPLPGSKEVKEQPLPVSLEVEGKTKMDNSATGLLGLAYGSSDDEEE